MPPSETQMRITVVDPGAIAHLLEASREYFATRYPAESNHGLAPHALRTPGCIALGASNDDQVVGCVALVPLEEVATAEVKGLFVDPRYRGRGIARALMAALEERANGAGYTTLLLETGAAEKEALGLYVSLGWERCGPFGDYVISRHSVYLTKGLASPRV